VQVGYFTLPNPVHVAMLCNDCRKMKDWRRKSLRRAHVLSLKMTKLQICCNATKSEFTHLAVHVV
jgi:hypothetical protein